MKKEFKGINHGKKQIDLRHLGNDALQLRPVEIHLKENGSDTDGPSFVIVMVGSEYIPAKVYGQITLDMFNEGLLDIGYKITKLRK